MWLIGWIALALAVRGDAQAISLASFTQPQGLLSLEDNCLRQDRSGFVYVCTENGLFRFDGHAFQRIGAANGLHGSFISALHQDAAGHLWVGTRSGLYAGDGQRFVLADDAVHPQSVDPGATLADLDGREYMVSRHHLWQIASAGGRWHLQPLFDAAVLRTTPALADITSVFGDGRALWFGCGKSLCEWNGHRLRVWSEREGIPADTWTSYLRGQDGTLWVRSPRYIRALPAGNDDAFVDRDLPGARVVTAYLDMIQDDQGRLLTRANDGLRAGMAGSGAYSIMATACPTSASMPCCMTATTCYG